jgi:hypothetical protein
MTDLDGHDASHLLDVSDTQDMLVWNTRDGGMGGLELELHHHIAMDAVSLHLLCILPSVFPITVPHT